MTQEKESLPKDWAAELVKVAAELKREFPGNKELHRALDTDDDSVVANFLQSRDLQLYNRWRGVCLAVRPDRQFNPPRGEEGFW